MGPLETIAEEPILYNPSPSNGAIGETLSPSLSIQAADAQGDSMNILFLTNASGPWITIGVNLSVYNGTYSCFDSSVFNSYNTQYWWSVHAIDPSGSENWTNITYSFTTEKDEPVISNESFVHSLKK